MIRFNHVRYTYSEDGPYRKDALKNVSFEIPSGTFWGLIGHTGSGKSTLTQLIAGLISATEGEVWVDGINLAAEKYPSKAVRGRVGLVFQYPEHQLFEETVYADIAFGPKNLGLSEQEIKTRVEEAISFVGLSTDVLERSPFDLSGGQKRRVAIAGVLAMKPEILILDEPTAGLDPAGSREILTQLSKLHKAWNNTVILVSHSMEDVAKTVDSVLVMERGSVRLSGTVREVFQQKEELNQIGLATPAIHQIMTKLKEQGLPVRTDILTVAEGTEELKKVFGGKI